MEAKDAFNSCNYSSLQIIKASELIEPAGWHLGREYYVVTEGLAVGVFHNLSVFIASLPVYAAYTKRDRSAVHRSVEPSLSRLWLTTKFWQEAVKMWDVACRTPGAVHILRKDANNATAPSAARAPTPCNSTGAPSAHCRVFDGPLPISTPSPSSFLVSKRQPPSVTIVISDSDSSNSSDSSDNEVEATYPKPIRKRVDCFDLTDDENGNPFLRKTYDAATDTHLDAPTRTKTSSQRKTAPRSSTWKRLKSPPPVASGSGSATAIHPS